MKRLKEPEPVSCSHSEHRPSTLAIGVVGGLLVVLVVSLVVFVLFRRQRIKRKRTVRRLLQEREVGPQNEPKPKQQTKYLFWF